MAWSDTACQKAVDWIREQGDSPIRSVMAYVPFRSELDTTLLIEWCWRTGVTVIMPRCIRSDRSMTLHVVRAWDELSPGAYGIREPHPESAERCPPAFIPDVVFVPGLAFDRHGGRLGYGGGYYDRFHDRLKRLAGESGRAMPHWIGLGFETQAVAAVPMDEHDARMHAVITEEGYRGGVQHGSDAF